MWTFLVEHTTFQFTLWALLSLILPIAVLVYFIIRNRKMKNQQNDLEDQLEEYYSKDSTLNPDAHKA